MNEGNGLGGGDDGFGGGDDGFDGGEDEIELQNLEKQKIIEPVQFSHWAAPIVPIVKADGHSIRICGDYKTTVNRAAKLDKYPIPRIEDLYAQLSGGKTFSKLDMSQAYLQLPLDEASKEYTVINTHRGLFRYNRLPFGISSAPGIFQRVADSLVQGIPHVVAYLDDLLITGSTEQEHLANLEEVLGRLSNAGLRLKKSKCSFQVPAVVYLGHKVNAKGLHPTDEKIRAIKEAPSPKNLTELRSYLGILNYYGKFLSNLPSRLAPLHALLQKEMPWKWSKRAEQAFQETKALLCSSSVLVHYDPSKQLVLSCDASPYGVGAVLSHHTDEGDQPICFASRTLTSAEQRYSQLDKEGLAVTFGVKKFHQYVYGRSFVIYTDHKPLLGLLGENKAIPQMASPRVQRWALMLSAYNYTLLYKAGSENANSDALSRLPLTDMPESTPLPGETVQLLHHLETTPANASTIRSWTDLDSTLS